MSGWRYRRLLRMLIPQLAASVRFKTGRHCCRFGRVVTTLVQHTVDAGFEVSYFSVEMKALALALIAMLLPLLMRGEEPELKAEIEPTAIVGPGDIPTIMVRLTNVSSKPVRIVCNPEGGDILGGPVFKVVVRESGGKEIGYGLCGTVPREADEPLTVVPDNFVVALEAGRSIEVPIRHGWQIPEDGSYSVSFEYKMPEKSSWPALYTFPSNVWHGSVRAKDVVVHLKERGSVDEKATIPFSSVQKTCVVLDRLKPGDSPLLLETVSNRLKELRDPTSIPAMERAVQRGLLGGLPVALGMVGNESSFSVILAAAEKSQRVDATRGLVALVARSNKGLEPWMTAEGRVVQPAAELIADWRRWWSGNKDDFLVLKTASGSTHRAVKRDQTSAR